MHWIFHEICEKSLAEKTYTTKNDREGKEADRGEKARTRALADLVRIKDEMMFYEKVDHHILLGGEYRNLLWELERTFNKYKDMEWGYSDHKGYHEPSPRKLGEIMFQCTDLFRQMKEFKARVHTYAYCGICKRSAKDCQDNDHIRCQNIINCYDGDTFLYRLHDTELHKFATCTGCQYMSIDEKHHLSTGGCLVGKITEVKLEMPGFVDPWAKTQADQVIAASKPDIETFKKVVLGPKKAWICAFCNKGPGNGKSGADHRVCVFEGFNCDPIAWEKASGIN